MSKKIVLSLIAIGALGLSACSNQKKNEESSNDLTIVTSFYPMYDFTKQVVGENGKVELLIESGVEPHDYEPSAKDMAKIQDADVFIYNSNEMETWVVDVLASIDTSKVKVIEASEGITLMTTAEDDDHDSEEVHDHDSEKEDVHETEEHHHHGADPHVWLDPVLVKQEVDNITKGLTDVSANKGQEFEENAETFKKELDELNDAYVAATKDATKRDFVTQHTAFSYLAKQYDLRQVAISGLSPEQEPTPKQLKHIQDFVETENISYIYTESSASSKVAKTISDATGAELLVLNPLESLSKKEQEQGADYLSVMYDNLDNLKKSIQ